MGKHSLGGAEGGGEEEEQVSGRVGKADSQFNSSGCTCMAEVTNEAERYAVEWSASPILPVTTPVLR